MVSVGLLSVRKTILWLFKLNLVKSSDKNEEKLTTNYKRFTLSHDRLCDRMIARSAHLLPHNTSLNGSTPLGSSSTAPLMACLWAPPLPLLP
jgi:hypothetical protein